MNAHSFLRLPHSCGWLWAARAAAVMLAAVLLWLVIAHGGLPPWVGQPWPVRYISLGCAVVIVSYAIGWLAPAAGGLIGLAGLALSNGAELAANGRFLGGLFPLLAVPSVLFLIAAWQIRRRGAGCPTD